MDQMHENFMVVDTDMATHYGSYFVILTRIEFWAREYAALEQWCQLHDTQLKGMTLSLSTNEALTAFILRWS